MREHRWLKAHIMTGVKTNIITGVEITEERGGDSPKFAPLVNLTASNGFELKEVLADKAYSSRDNIGLIDELGGIAYIPFKKKSRARTMGKSHAWRKLFYYFQYNQEEFMEHYHKRSNAESTFNMIKTKFNDLLKSKTKTAQENELLLKILCHNIVVLIHETNELGIETKFNN